MDVRVRNSLLRASGRAPPLSFGLNFNHADSRRNLVELKNDEIAGIVIGAVAFVVLVGLIVWCLMKRSSSSQEWKSEHKNTTEDNYDSSYENKNQTHSPLKSSSDDESKVNLSWEMNPLPQKRDSQPKEEKLKLGSVEKDVKAVSRRGSNNSTASSSAIYNSNSSNSDLRERRANNLKDAEPLFEEYSATLWVKPGGHRVRIHPGIHAAPVHLIVPSPGFYLKVMKTMNIDEMIWGKLHPSMFPEGFTGCNVNLDGWTLLQDKRDPNSKNHITYWEKGTGVSTFGTV